MPRKRGSDLTLSAIRKELEERGSDAILRRGSMVVGAVMVVGGVVVAGPAALGLLAGKDEAFKVATALMGKSRKRRKDGPLERVQRMLTAHQLLVYSAFLEAANEILQFIKDYSPSSMTESDLVALALDEMAGEATGPDPASELKQKLILAAPHPADTLEDYGLPLYRFYTDLASGLSTIVDGLSAHVQVSEDDRARIDAALETLALHAVAHYNAQFYALVADVPEFRAWMQLRDQELLLASLDRLPEEVAKRLAELPVVEHADRDLDAPPVGPPAAERQSHVREAQTELDRTYGTAVAEPIVENRMGLGPSNPTLSFPARREAFIPQAFQALLTPSSSAPVHLADEATWAHVPVGDDLPRFLLRFLELPESISLPLLILGPPGSGKSLLTEMIAADIAAEDFTRLRVELRVDAIAPSIYKQLELQIERDTNGRRITWAEFSKEIDRPPLAIFDGFDELLLTGGSVHVSYLEELQRFQRIESAQERPLRAIITSRTTPIHKASVPPGSTVVRLCAFDDRRRDEWITRWNKHNARRFAAGTRRFALPDRADVLALAEQPLLLVLLALFDADGNQLGNDSVQVRRARLYNNLLTNFIRRQCQKGAGERTLSDDELAAPIAADMQRLGAAAMSMFNRRTLDVPDEQLKQDLRFFGCSDGGEHNADNLFGELVFVHASRRSASGATDTYEFQHHTFGEFLVADFILRMLVEEVRDQISCTRPADYARRIEETSQPHGWCGRMMFTGLHTRPVVLEMMRSWLPDLLEEYGVERSAFVTQHDVFLRAQLDRIFAKSPTSTSFADNPAPYEPLPLIGHYATYTLNMIMVRVAVAHEAFVVDDGGAPAEARGRRWDQLRNLWRSWFADEDITAASTFLDSTHDGDHVLVWARDSPLKPDAMADVGLGAERLDVALELLMRIVRAAGWPRDSERLDVLGRCAHDAVRLIATSHSHVDLLTALTAPEAPRHLRAETARVMLHPRDLTGLWSLPDAFATAYISFCASAAPKWGADMVVQTLGGETPERPARQAPMAFAACVDAAYPTRSPAYAIPGIKDPAWLAGVIRRLTKQDEIEPVVLIALLDLAARISVQVDDAKLVDECLERLRKSGRDGLPGVSNGRVRRLVELASEAPGDGMCEWLLSATALFEPTLPGDIAIDLDRLRLVVEKRTRIDRDAVTKWPILHAASDVAALSRLLAYLDPTETGDADASILGRQGVLRALTDPEGPGFALRMTPQLEAAASSYAPGVQREAGG